MDVCSAYCKRRWWAVAVARNIMASATYGKRIVGTAISVSRTPGGEMGLWASQGLKRCIWRPRYFRSSYARRLASALPILFMAANPKSRLSFARLVINQTSMCHIGIFIWLEYIIFLVWNTFFCKSCIPNMSLSSFFWIPSFLFCKSCIPNTWEAGLEVGKSGLSGKKWKQYV